MSERYTSEQYTMFIGTYTRREAHADGKSRGIYVFRFDVGSGTAVQAAEPVEAVNPSFVAVHPNKQLLLAVNEVNDFGGKSSGAVSSFAIDEATKALTFRSQQPTHGAAPCHLAIDATGRYVISANYTGGSVSVHPIRESGSLGASTDFIQHQGSSIHPQRQTAPHAHSANIDRQNRFVLVCDLGIDRVMIYELDLEEGKLRPNAAQPWARVKSGAGPRHLDFHPNDKWVYVLNEIGSTITAFEWDAERGTMTEIDTISTLPEDFTERNGTADIHVHPSGKFVYSSNRGHDSIAIFSVKSDGSLSPLGYTPTGGKTPRNFALDPTGNYLLAANQNSDNIVVFEIDPKTGKLTPTGHVIQVPTPVCIRWLEAS
jgi:6-phosphogluconolactonase